MMFAGVRLVRPAGGVNSAILDFCDVACACGESVVSVIIVCDEEACTTFEQLRRWLFV